MGLSVASEDTACTSYNAAGDCNEERFEMATVFLPPQWRELAGGRDLIRTQGSTLRAVLRELDRQFPGIAQQVSDGESIAPGIAVSIDGSITNRGLLAPIGPDSEIHFLPAIGGG